MIPGNGDPEMRLRQHPGQTKPFRQTRHLIPPHPRGDGQTRARRKPASRQHNDVRDFSGRLNHRRVNSDKPVEEKGGNHGIGHQQKEKQRRSQKPAPPFANENPRSHQDEQQAEGVEEVEKELLQKIRISV